MKSRPKVLITIPWFLPAFRAGGPIRSVANLIESFPEAEYYIYTSDTDVNGAMLDNVVSNEWVPYNDRTQVWYAGPGKISQNLLKQTELLKPDVLLMIGLYSWHYTLVPLIYCKVKKKIISVRGMLHPGALSRKKLKKRLFLKGFRLFELQYKASFHATDSKEKEFIHNHLGETANVFVAANFPTILQKMQLPEKAETLKLISICLVSPMKNILLILDALQQVSTPVEYSIYGSIKDEEYWMKCKNAIKNLPTHISVRHEGELPPAKLNEALSDSHVFILPSESENFGHAIYEALSAGRPVITSEFTPWKGLKAANAGINVPLEKGPIAEAITFFATLSDLELERWSQGASDYASNNVDKEKTIAGYRSMFDTIG